MNMFYEPVWGSLWGVNWVKLQFYRCYDVIDDVIMYDNM